MQQLNCCNEERRPNSWLDVAIQLAVKEEIQDNSSKFFCFVCKFPHFALEVMYNMLARPAALPYADVRRSGSILYT